MTRIRIHGITNSHAERDVEQITGRRAFIQGTDRSRLIEFSHRSDAQMAVLALQNYGLRAKIDGDLEPGTTDIRP